MFLMLSSLASNSIAKPLNTKSETTADKKCSYCNGSGTCGVCLGAKRVECSKCDGTGRMKNPNYNPYSDSKAPETVTCDACNGQKTVRCKACNGSGTCAHCKGTGTSPY